METAFFYQVFKLSEERENAFIELCEESSISYCYFRADETYYLFAYSENEEAIDFRSVQTILEPIRELHTRKRKIRSLRGYILYVKEIMETAKTKLVLQSNLSWFFWENTFNIISQNRAKGLESFLYKEPRKDPRRHVDTPFIHPGPTAPRMQQKADEHPFKKLSEIPKGTLEKIVSSGFKLQDQQEISSLKNYFESTEEWSVAKTYGYSIKYDSIRKAAIFKKTRDALKNE